MIEAPGRVKNLAPPPAFATAEEERRHRKVHLAGAFRLFARFGFDEGVAGHITVRDPEHADWFWVNPFGMHFSQIRASDLMLVNDHGEVIEGDHPSTPPPSPSTRASTPRGPIPWLPRTRIPFTARRGRPSAACSTPSPRMPAPSTRTTAFSTIITGVVYETSEGDRIARALGKAKAVILRNHGLLTVGSSVDEAAWWFITMERSCQAQLLAEAAGKPVLISHENALDTRDQVAGGHQRLVPISSPCGT